MYFMRFFILTPFKYVPNDDLCLLFCIYPTSIQYVLTEGKNQNKANVSHSTIFFI